jgi:hypothetical protein
MVRLTLTAKEAERRAYIDGWVALSQLYAQLPPHQIVSYCVLA